MTKESAQPEFEQFFPSNVLEPPPPPPPPPSSQRNWNFNKTYRSSYKYLVKVFLAPYAGPHEGPHDPYGKGVGHYLLCQPTTPSLFYDVEVAMIFDLNGDIVVEVVIGMCMRKRGENLYGMKSLLCS